MRRVLCIFCLFLTLSLCLWTQTVTVQEKEDKPLMLPTADGQMRSLFSSSPPVKPDAYTIRYVNISPGPNGSILSYRNEQVGLHAVELINEKLIDEFYFPSLNITVSAASRIVTEDAQYKISGKIEDKMRPLTALRQMNINVRLTALDADKSVIKDPVKPINADLKDSSDFVREFGKEPLLTLQIAPYETASLQGQPQPQDRWTQGITTATNAAPALSGIGLGLVATFLNPLGKLAGGVAAVFNIACPTKNLPSQVSYQSSASEFGWIWREQENSNIEGIYRCMALLRTHKSVKYIRAEVELITDWKKFGAWVKQMEFIVPVIPGDPKDLLRQPEEKERPEKR